MSHSCQQWRAHIPHDAHWVFANGIYCNGIKCSNAGAVGVEQQPAPYITKDSGERRAFETGSQRDSASGKGRYDLLPLEAIHRLAQAYERGAEKYDDRNWEKGQPLSVVTSSMLRHAFQATAGLEDEDHLAAVAWNAFAAITILERIKAGKLPPELDDRP